MIKVNGYFLADIVVTTLRNRRMEVRPEFVASVCEAVAHVRQPSPLRDSAYTAKHAETVISLLERLIGAEEMRQKTRAAIASYFSPRVVWTRSEMVERFGEAA